MLLDKKNKCLKANPDFIYDEACLDVNNYRSIPLTIYGQYDECYLCNWQKLGSVEANNSTSILINTKYSFQSYFGNSSMVWCGERRLYSEHYRYDWNITDNSCGTITIKTPADNAYLPILSAMIIFFFFGTIWYMVKCIYKCVKNSTRMRHYFPWSNEIQTDLGTPSDGTPLVIERQPPVRKHPYRVKSVDVFRGLCIMLMIFVNYGGGKYYFFQHSVWNGLTVADLVFPWFLWIMGLSMMISLDKKFRDGVPRRQLYYSVLIRSFVLIILGLILNSHGTATPLSSLRFTGVLQRIGITYFIVAVMELCFARCSFTTVEGGRLSFLQDLIVSWPQWIIVGVLITIHTCITFLLYVPGCGRGYLGPGGLERRGDYANCTGGAAGYIDRLILGEHMYKKPTCHQLYETTQYYDPEGILGTLTAVLTVYLGTQAGRILLMYTGVKERVIRWYIWGITTGIIGGLLTNFSKNTGVIPVNKNLWSLSYVLITASFAFIMEGFLFIVVDITRKWGGRPFFYPGMNAILLYVGHILFKNTFPFAWNPQIQTHAAYLAMNLWGMALWVAIAVVLYKKNIFLSV